MPRVPGSYPAMAGGGLGAVTGMTPLIRARQRAQGVMGQLRRLLSQPVTGFDMTQAPPASAALAPALSAQRVQAETHYSGMVTIAEDYSPAAVVQVAGAVREMNRYRTGAILVIDG